MTIWDASIKLYAWYAEHHSFCLDTDEKKLLEGVKRKKFERKEELAAIKCALEELKTLDMVACSSVDGQEVWVLKKGFETLSQTISLSPETCHSISVIVNGFCDLVGNSVEKSDPKEINEADIKNLLFVSSYLMDNQTPNADTNKEEAN